MEPKWSPNGLQKALKSVKREPKGRQMAENAGKKACQKRSRNEEPKWMPQGSGTASPAECAWPALAFGCPLGSLICLYKPY